MKKIISLLLCAVLCLSMCAAAFADSACVDSLTIAITKDENTLSPFTYVSGTGLTVNRLIYDTLFTTDLDNNIIPWMVEDDFTVENAKVFTFTLKEGLKFHNGNPVTPEDIKFSFEYPANQNVSGQRKVCNKIESIEVLDARTVRFTLKNTDVNFMRDGFAFIRILDDAVYEGVETGSTVLDTIGSGPYKLVEYKTGEYYKLEAVEDYFAGDIRVKHINMPIMSDSQQALMTGELAASTGSVSVEMLETFEAIDGLAVFANAGYAPMIVNFNDGRAPFDDVTFRQAISYAVDVNGIADILYGGYAMTGTRGAVRADLPYAVEGLEYTYDAEKAVSILESQGYTELNSNGIRLDENGEPLSFEIITYAGNNLRSRCCELMQEQLKAVGIDLVIVTLDMDTADAYIWPDFEVASGRDYDLSTWGWSNSISMTYLISLCSSNFDIGTYNVCGYVSEAFDNIVAEKLESVTSEEEMHELLQELQLVIAEEIPLLTIGFPDSLQVCNTNLYDGWKAGAGANVVNIFSFLAD